MPDSEFLSTLKRIVRENPDAFEALEEYDRTRRLRKISYKTRANFTIDSAILRRFRSYCAENGYNMSKVLENHIKEELRKTVINTNAP